MLQMVRYHKYERRSREARKTSAISSNEGVKREETGVNGKGLCQAEKTEVQNWRTVAGTERQKSLRNTRERTERGQATRSDMKSQCVLRQRRPDYCWMM